MSINSIPAAGMGPILSNPFQSEVTSDERPQPVESEPTQEVVGPEGSLQEPETEKLQRIDYEIADVWSDEWGETRGRGLDWYPPFREEKVQRERIVAQIPSVLERMRAANYTNVCFLRRGLATATDKAPSKIPEILKMMAVVNCSLLLTSLDIFHIICCGQYQCLPQIVEIMKLTPEGKCGLTIELLELKRKELTPQFLATCGLAVDSALSFAIDHDPRGIPLIVERVAGSYRLQPDHSVFKKAAEKCPEYLPLLEQLK